MPLLIRVNLGGEGEIPGILNVQGPWALRPSWRSADGTKTLQDLRALGHRFIISNNLPLPFADNSVDEVYTNSVPIDTVGLNGPGVQSSEVRRILKSGRRWINDGKVHYVKP
jgi:hypothetical protein